MTLLCIRSRMGLDFIVQDDFHEEHDKTWAVFSQHYACPVCLGCIVETLEDSQKLCVQKKPAITELLRLLTYQAGDILQLFRQEEEIVWHLAEILLDSFKETEESYLSMAIDTSLKLVQQISSDDLVMFYLDAINKQVMSEMNHDVLLPHYTLLGKMLFLLPPLAVKLIHDYDQLLHQLSLDLCSPRETIQSAVAYLFIFLCDGQLLSSMSPRLKQQLSHGVLKMLATVQTQSVQLNGLGLLQAILGVEESSHNLMSLNIAGTTLVSILKKLLLSKREVLQIGVIQVLSLLLQKPAGRQNGAAILESDLAEFLFEALHTENVILMKYILSILQHLAQNEYFYKHCHAVYGIESVMRSLSTAIELKNPPLLTLGYQLLAEILQRQPKDVPIFVSGSVVRNCLSLIETGIMHHQTSVSSSAIKAAKAILRKEHLLLPVPFFELIGILEAIASRTWAQLKDNVTRKTKSKTNSQAVEQESRQQQLLTYISLLEKSVRLATQCLREPTTCESTFTAPCSDDNETVPPLEIYVQTLLQVIDDNCIPLFMIHWDNIENKDTYQQYFDTLMTLQEIDHSFGDDIINKLVETGFLSSVLEVKAKYRIEVMFVESINRFLVNALKCALLKEAIGTLNHNLFLDCLEDKVKKINYNFSEFRQTVFEESLDKETAEMYITMLYFCYRNGNRPLLAGDLQRILSKVVETSSCLEEMSALTCRHYIFLLAWSVVNEDMHMWSTTPLGLGSLHGILNGPMEVWYTHDVLLLQWCYSDVVLATKSGTAMLTAYLTSCSEVELQTVTGDSEDDQQELFQLCRNPSFRHSLLECVAHGSKETTYKAMLLENYYLDQLRSTSLIAAEQSVEDGLYEAFNCVTEILLKLFLGNFPVAKEHNTVALLELTIKIQKMLLANPGVDIKILYHVLNQFGHNKKLSEEMKSTCMEVVAAALSRSTDNQVSAVVIQNQKLLYEIELDVRERQATFEVSCDILSSLISSSSASQVPYAVSINMESLVNYMYSGSTVCKLAVLHLLEKLFQVQLLSPVVKYTAKVNSSHYHTLYIYLQQFIVQGLPELQDAAITCLEKMVRFLMEIESEIGTELLSQPWNPLMLDVLVDSSLEIGLSTSVATLLTLFFDHCAGVFTSNRTLSEKLIRCFHTDISAGRKGSQGTDLLKKRAAHVLLSTPSA